MNDLGRHSPDVQIAELAIAFKDIAIDVRELKDMLQDQYVPRIADLESWRLTVTATELEREKLRVQQFEQTREERQGLLGKHQFWIGVVAIVVSNLVGIAGIILAHG